MHAESSPSHALIRNAHLQLSATASPFSLTLSAVSPSGPIPILRRVGQNHLTEPLRAELPDACTLEILTLSDSTLLVIRGTVGPATLSISLRLRENSSWLEVAELYAFDPPHSPTRPAIPLVDSFEATWQFIDRQHPFELHSPHLVPEPTDVIGRHVLRSPALCVSSDSCAAALIADPDYLRRQQPLPPCMNLLQADGGPLLRTGLRPHEVRSHVYFKDAPSPQRPLTLHHAYQLHVAAAAAPGHALQAAASRLWQHSGTRSAAAAPAAPMSYSDYARQIYPRLFEQRWVESTLNGQRIGAITMNRSYRHDVWMCPWFSQLRSAYGLFLWGRTLHEPDWTARALATRDLHLAAPQSRGLFPTVFVFGNTPDSHRWVHSHHQGGGNNIYHLFDMSWTVYQLLRWHTDILPHAPSVEFARRYAHGLMALQAPAGSPMPGSLPAYVDATTLAPMAHVDHAALRADLAAHPGGDGYVAWGLKDAWSQERFTNSAEDSASLLCLAALVATLRPDDPDRPRFLAAAKNIASFLEHHIFPTACWKDFEVYYSCAPKPLDFYDHRSGQHPINTLCLHMAAAGLLALHQITGEPHHLDLAHQALAKLSLFQQVWDSPNLNFHGFGGYGCMNTDGEWNDARQGQFADTHLDFYLATRSAEQLQRAQAACRAAFATLFHPANTAIYPTGWNRTPIGQAAENHGHGGSDGLNGVSSFDWGSGSALATAAYYHHKLGPQ